MKSLKESILSSTNTGKVAITRKKIEDWCNEHLKYYKITPDCKVINVDDTHIFLLTISEVPEYIKFGNITSEFVIGDVINKMTQEQLPECVKHFRLCDCERIEKPFVFNITDSFATGTLGREELFKNGFKKLTIASKNNGYKPNSVISFAFSKLYLKHLKKAQFVGEFETLNLRATPAGNSLIGHIKHRAKMLGQSKLSDDEVTYLLKTLVPNIVDHFTVINTDEFYFKKSRGRYHEWSIL
jgi:hypothetical protein